MVNSSQTKNTMQQKSDNGNIEEIIKRAVKLPIARVNRKNFLSKELGEYYPKEIVEMAVKNNPACAGVAKEHIKKIAEQVIVNEINKAATLERATFSPIVLPAVSIEQKIGFMLTVIQELAYLYGFPDFELNEREIPDEKMNQLLILLGVMMGVEGADEGVKLFADAVAQNALPLLGMQIERQIFEDTAAKLIQLINGLRLMPAISPYPLLKPKIEQLKNIFAEQSLCDPEYYRQGDHY